MKALKLVPNKETIVEPEHSHIKQHGLSTAMITAAVIIAFGLYAAISSSHASKEDVMLYLEKEVNQSTELRSTVLTKLDAVDRSLRAHENTYQIFLKIMVLKRDIPQALARRIAKAVYETSVAYNKDPDLILSIIYVESHFDPEAESYAGAQGLMQIMPMWHNELPILGSLKNVENSVKWGTHILNFYQQTYKDLEIALTVYNKGPNQVQRELRGGGDPRDNYARRTMSTYNRLKQLSI